MVGSTQQIFTQALRLTPIEKAELIEQLFHSFDSAKQKAVDALWADEVEARIDAFDAKKLKARPFAAVFKQLNKK